MAESALWLDPMPTEFRADLEGTPGSASTARMSIAAGPKRSQSAHAEARARHEAHLRAPRRNQPSRRNTTHGCVLKRAPGRPKRQNRDEPAQGLDDPGGPVIARESVAGSGPGVAARRPPRKPRRYQPVLRRVGGERERNCSGCDSSSAWLHRCLAIRASRATMIGVNDYRGHRVDVVGVPAARASTPRCVSGEC